MAEDTVKTGALSRIVNVHWNTGKPFLIVYGFISIINSEPPEGLLSVGTVDGEAFGVPLLFRGDIHGDFGWSVHPPAIVVPSGLSSNIKTMQQAGVVFGQGITTRQGSAGYSCLLWFDLKPFGKTGTFQVSFQYQGSLTGDNDSGVDLAFRTVRDLTTMDYGSFGFHDTGWYKGEPISDEQPVTGYTGDLATGTITVDLKTLEATWA